MMSKHTEGPWYADDADGSYGVWSEEGPLVALTQRGMYPNARPLTDSETDANARLIAAAPDLLAACRATLAHMYDDETDAPTAAQLTEQLTRAIAKAEGGQQ